MPISFGHGANGITISFGGSAKGSLKPDPFASQTNPTGCYVYGHRASTGQLFYIGKGTGRRAWDRDRHTLWHRYVEKHLSGKYEVVILKDNLDAAEAEHLEAEWTNQESESLVNWTNFSRPVDLNANAKYHALRAGCLSIAAQAKSLEGSDLDGAIGLYAQALASISQFAHIQSERGLVGRLMAEEREEFGVNGELRVLDRLTLCLCRAGRGKEAKTIASKYFAEFRDDLNLVSAQRILKRIEKAANGS